MIPFFAQEESPGFRQLIGPLLAIIGFVIFNWINAKIKRKESEQRDEDQERYQRENQEGMPRRSGTAQGPAQSSRPRPAENIHRYEPQIPAAPAPSDWRSSQQTESEKVFVAQDVTAAALSQRVHQQKLQQQHLRAEAQRKAQILAEAQRRRQAAAIKAKRAAEAAQVKAVAQAKASRSLHDGDLDAIELVLASDVSGLKIDTSRAQLRQAVVWAEILGPPRALRTYSFAY